MTYETKYAIDDVVFTADVGGVEKRFILAVRITPKHIQYGFKSNRSDHFFGLGLLSSDYLWLDEDRIFLSRDEAEEAAEKMRQQYDAERAEREKKERERKLFEARKRVEELERGIEGEEDE